ncbi:GGDEF domain-containing protein [Kineococcus sp. NPDC059986]|uniref:GGDEF domain-containing protein n=1 Tax=Kineococcus sp. NPDC059986 TaxID=3155538 RepID=UPI00344BE10F
MHEGTPRALRLGAAVVGAALLATLVRHLLSVTGLPQAPLWTQVVGWPLALLLRSDDVQRLIGGGRLDSRVGLRLVLGCSTFALVIVPSGLTFLFPLFATLVTSVHVQWSGARTWRTGVAVTVLATAAVQAAAHLGAGPAFVPALVPADVGDTAAVVALVASVATTVNIAVIAARREEADAELLHRATHDPLTGALNRAGLQEALAATPGAGTAVLYVDLDDFKPVNDRYGHAAGDHVLQVTARRLGEVLPAGHRLARVGGDEFVAVVPGLAGPAALEALLDRVQSAMREPVDLGGPDADVVPMSASVGGAPSSTSAPGDGEDLLSRADRSMYAQKAARASR